MGKGKKEKEPQESKEEVKEEKPKKKDSYFSPTAWFFWLWPNEKKPYFTEEGQRMRLAMTATTSIHCILYLVCLVLVGFWPMMYNIILAAWSYSCQLTLREREIIFYFVLVILFMVLQFMRLFDDKAEGSIQTLSGMIVAGMYALCLWISGRYYYAFRVSGGLRGSVDNSKQARKYRKQRRETETSINDDKKAD